MKNNIKFSILLLSILFVIIFSAFQEKSDNRATMLKAFCEDLFIKNLDSHKIFEKFVETENNKASINDSVMKKFDNHLGYLKTEKKHLVNSTESFEIKAYNKYLKQDDLLSFDERARNDIYIVLVNNRIEFYTLFDDARIVALNHVQKGKEGPAYFIPF